MKIDWSIWNIFSITSILTVAPCAVIWYFRNLNKTVKFFRKHESNNLLDSVFNALAKVDHINQIFWRMNMVTQIVNLLILFVAPTKEIVLVLLLLMLSQSLIFIWIVWSPYP
jgi:hypothetical protein